MASNLHGNFKVVSARFGASSDDEKKKILQERNAANTNKATISCVKCFQDYLKEKQLPDVDAIENRDLPQILEDFYVNARTKKTNERYHVQSLKCLRAGLNRYLQEKRNINIINDSEYSHANLMFKGVQVQAKKEGKGVRRSTPSISENDMASLAYYFRIDHITNPNPRILQKNVIFNIIYFLCRRGQENLYEMTKDWFQIDIDDQGREYLHQIKDELDKNHRENDYELTNQGRMYAVPGKNISK